MVSLSINADEGATPSKKTVAKNFSKAHARSITLGHFNHPEGKTAECLSKILPRLLDEGHTFATLTTVLG